MSTEQIPDWKEMYYAMKDQRDAEDCQCPVKQLQEELQTALAERDKMKLWIDNHVREVGDVRRQLDEAKEGEQESIRGFNTAYEELKKRTAERDDALARLAEVTNLIALHLIDNKNLRADLAALTLANAEMRKALTQVMEISESIRPDLPLPTILKLLAQRHAVYTAALSSPPALAKVLADAMDLAQKLRSAADSLNSADLADALITALAPYVTKL